MRQPTLSKFNRRQFLRRSSAGLVLAQFMPASRVLGAAGVSANEKVNVAGIGIGSRGGADIDSISEEGHNLVALCDVDDTYAAKSFAKYPKARQFKDFRVMLDKRSEEHTSELQSHHDLVCRLLLAN